MIMDLHVWARIPNLASPESLEKITWTLLSVSRRPSWSVIITQAGKTNIPPATCTKRKDRGKKMLQNNLPTSSLYFWWLFFPSTNLSASTLENAISSTTWPHINFSPGWFYILFLSLNSPTLKLRSHRFGFNTLLRLAAAILRQTCAVVAQWQCSDRCKMPTCGQVGGWPHRL